VRSTEHHTKKAKRGICNLGTAYVISFMTESPHMLGKETDLEAVQKRSIPAPTGDFFAHPKLSLLL
jgi:hypothetical protein